MRGGSTSGGRLAAFRWSAGTTGRRSPFCVRLIISVEGAAPEEAVATDTSIPMTTETIVRSTLQPLMKYLRARPVDENKSLRSDVCGNIPGSPHLIGQSYRERPDPKIPILSLREAPEARGSMPGRAASYRIVQDSFISRIPAIKAMRTRSERLAACILIMRLAR